MHFREFITTLSFFSSVCLKAVSKEANFIRASASPMEVVLSFDQSKHWRASRNKWIGEVTSRTGYTYHRQIADTSGRGIHGSQYHQILVPRMLRFSESGKGWFFSRENIISHVLPFQTTMGEGGREGDLANQKVNSQYHSSTSSPHEGKMVTDAWIYRLSTAKNPCHDSY